MGAAVTSIPSGPLVLPVAAVAAVPLTPAERLEARPAVAERVAARTVEAPPSELLPVALDGSPRQQLEVLLAILGGDDAPSPLPVPAPPAPVPSTPGPVTPVPAAPEQPLPAWSAAVAEVDIAPAATDVPRPVVALVEAAPEPVVAPVPAPAAAVPVAEVAAAPVASVPLPAPATEMPFVVVPVQAPSPFVPAGPPALVAELLAAVAEPRVELGFRDGTTTSLQPGSAQARALEDLARLLTSR